MRKMDLEWVQQRQEKKVQASFISEITFFKEVLLFGFATNTEWAQHWNELLSVRLLALVSCYIVEMSLRILEVTLKTVWRWCLREWQANELFSVYAERDWLASSDIIWKVQRDYLDFCVLILSEMKICSEVTRWTSCRSWLLLVTGRSLTHCQSWQPRGNLVSKWLSLKSTRNFITCHNL